MKTATVLELRENCDSLLEHVSAGEEILIMRQGEPVARLVPEKAADFGTVNWSDAPEVTRDRSNEKVLTAQEALDLIHEAAGKW